MLIETARTAGSIVGGCETAGLLTLRILNV
jgi:hypothetical protein